MLVCFLCNCRADVGFLNILFRGSEGWLKKVVVFFVFFFFLLGGGGYFGVFFEKCPEEVTMLPLKPISDPTRPY